MHLWDLMRGAWYILESYPHHELDDVIESLPDLVKGTECYMPSDASRIELESLNEVLAKALVVLQQQQILDESIISAVAGLKNIVVSERLVVSVPGRMELGEFREQNAFVPWAPVTMAPVYHSTFVPDYPPTSVPHYHSTFNVT
ncbi:uncharacterized protein BJ212DRAFT_1488112 [Suillus subaureus]|uniref:Uncharacterized protein n=1 Tax=Suillus subaureus TaxID=48587 RepID=A0A9P7DPP1_9AGAM|nr:uncharacterized protein BJ212DRAFT_1488112 [Suillus subaureus]KAG1800070.1 hypothetical protein BJ212DRAFT_1488112 [Suillus subaureus]